MVLRRIFVPKRDEVTGGWRTLHNEELVLFPKYNLNDHVKKDYMGGVCSTNREKRNAYRILVRKPEGKRPLGIPKRRWVDNIKLCFRDIGWDGADWIDMAQESSCEHDIERMI
jgi:hypothetical protein